MFSIFKINNNILLDTYLNRIASGDMSALEMLYNETRVNVYAYAFSILKNTSDSEDVMQDVYLNIYKYAQSYSSRNKPLSWILTITKNLCVEKLRKKKKIIYDDIEKIENIIMKVQLPAISDNLSAIFSPNVSWFFSSLSTSMAIELSASISIISFLSCLSNFWCKIICTISLLSFFDILSHS